MILVYALLIFLVAGIGAYVLYDKVIEPLINREFNRLTKKKECVHESEQEESPVSEPRSRSKR